MEELERFAKKAKYYRQALETNPSARLLEIYPILWYLERHRNSLGKRRKNLRIVDLMSGSGFLSENLFKLGYTDLHAVEFCKEMYQDASAYRKVRLHTLSSFDHLEGVLGELRPDVIISLASFHHLIVYGHEGQVDKQASTELQSHVVDICMRALPDQGVLMIADLIENEVKETPLEPFKSPMKNISASLGHLGIDGSIVDILKLANSLHSASSILHREFGTKSINVGLDWFRTTVDKKTSVGHKDIALSKDFVEKVSNYRPIVTKYVCPWIFKNDNDLAEFVFNKFGFALDERKKGGLTKDDVKTLVIDKLGIRKNHGVSALNWNLGVVLLGKIEPFSVDRKHYLYLASLATMAIVLVVALLLRFFANIYIELSPKDIFVFSFTLPIGILLGDLITRKSNLSP